MHFKYCLNLAHFRDACKPGVHTCIVDQDVHWFVGLVDGMRKVGNAVEDVDEAISLVTHASLDLPQITDTHTCSEHEAQIKCTHHVMCAEQKETEGN